MSEAGAGGIDALVVRARREVDEGILPSCQLALARDGELVRFETIGAPAGSRYVMYSCTKAVVAAAMWQVLAEGKLELADKVVDHIPEFGTNGKDVVTVEQLLLHTGGFPFAPLGPAVWADRSARLAAFERWRLNWEPGSRFEYHATSGHWVVAELLARVDGADHRDVLARRVLEPLGLRRMRVGLPPAEQGDLQRVELRGEPPTVEEFRAALGVDGIDVGEVTDDAMMLYAQPEVVEVGVPGGGGVSDAADLAMLYQAMLRNEGGLWHPDWLAAGTAEVRCSLPDLNALGAPANRTLGLVMAGDDARGHLRGFGKTNGPRSFGHGGAGGQVAWADPGTGLSFAYLTNGLDRHTLRQGRRGVALSSRAAVC